MSDPGQILAAIDADARALDTASKQLAKLIPEMGAAQIQYEDAYAHAINRLIDAYRDAGERLPGEDVRRSLVFANEPDVMSAYREKCRLEREVEAWQQWGRLKLGALNGRQSELSFLRAEAGVAT